jgi:hypothetical protein
VKSVQDDVVAGVGDHRHISGIDDPDEATQELPGPHTPGKRNDHALTLSPVRAGW